MNEELKFRKVKAGHYPILDPGATSQPFITEDGFLLTVPKSEFDAGVTSSGLPQILNVEDTGIYTYVGKADQGSADSDVKWAISRVTNTTGNIRYPSNYATTKVAWTTRVGLTYN